MMKKIDIILATFLFSFIGVLLGCSKESSKNGGDMPVPTDKAYNVSFSLSVGVETYSIPAQDYEKNISNFQVLLFNSANNFVEIPDVLSIDPLTNLYGFSFHKEGQYKMLVVANHRFKATELYGKSITQVGEMLIDRAEPGTAHKFVMVSQKKDFNILPHQITTIGQINLTRLAARIDIQTDLVGLVLNKVTVNNRKTQSALLAQSNTDSYTKESKEYITFTDFGVASNNTSIGQIYTFENSKAGTTTEGISLTIETTYNGSKVKPITVPLPVVKRNYIYSVQLTMSNKDEKPDERKLSFVLTVLDWQNGAVINIPAEKLLDIIKEANRVTFYTISASSNPDISSGKVTWQGIPTVQLTPTAQKVTTIAGNPDPQYPPVTITGADKFNYEVINASSHPWLKVTADGKITIAPNDTTNPREGSIKVTVKEDTNKPKSEYILRISQAGVPVVSYTISVGTNPDISGGNIRWEGISSVQLSPTAKKVTTVGGKPDPTYPPVTITGVDKFNYEVVNASTHPWLKVTADGKLTISPNDTTQPREGAIRVTVKEDANTPKSEFIVLVTQVAAPPLTTSYTISVASTPNITSGSITWEGISSVQLIPTAQKKFSRGGKPDAAHSPIQITGADKFNYEVINASTHPWLKVTADGKITIAPNDTTNPREGSIKVTVKEDTNKPKSEYIVRVTQAAAPPINTIYSLQSVTPNSLSFSKDGGTQQIFIRGEVKNMRGNKVVSSRAMSLSDVSVKPINSVSWLSVNGDKISVQKNTTARVRTITLKISVVNAPTQFKTIEVQQNGNPHNNPLSYVAHYNIMRNKTWNTYHSVLQNVFDDRFNFTWNDAMDLFKNPQSIEGSKELYKLPTYEQLLSIVPSHGILIRHYSLNEINESTDRVSIANQTFDATSEIVVRNYYLNEISEINSPCAVSLRYKGNNPNEKPFKSAWLYYYGDYHHLGNNMSASGFGFHVFCVNVADDSTIKSVDDLDEEWWNAHLSEAVYRFFVLGGSVYSSNDPRSRVLGGYWSSTKVKDSPLIFEDGSVVCYSIGVMRDKFEIEQEISRYGICVRLFSNEPLD